MVHYLFLLLSFGYRKTGDGNHAILSGGSRLFLFCKKLLDFQSIRLYNNELAMNIELIAGKNRFKPEDILTFETLLQDENSIAYSDFGFDKKGEIVLVRAPARLDLMGGIADYCGANVFEATLSNAVVMGSQVRGDRLLQVFSIGVESEGLTPSLNTSLDDFYADGKLKEYDEIKSFFKSNPKTAWAGYVLGAFYVLLKENRVKKFESGLNLLIQSNVPMGAGISSSAAIEVATMMSVNEQYQLNLSLLEIARLAQIVENRVVGAPCGIMDQITSVAGEEGKVISILCRPDKILELVQLPEEVCLLGINSKVKRSTAGSAYTDARTAAFMGLTILTKKFGLEELSGYLCNLSVKDFRGKYWDSLPTSINGSTFLAQYGETIDRVTKVNPDKTYRVRSRTEHPIYENDRVKQFIECLKKATDEGNREKAKSHLIQAGKLMYASHWSYRQRVGLGSPNVDMIVNKIREIGTEGGLFGAKITGGGGGGTVAVLCVGDVSESIEKVILDYKEKTEIDAGVLTGSSPGAAQYGCLRYKII